MKFKQVGDFRAALARRLPDRLAGLVRPLVGLRIALMVLAYPSGLAAQPAGGAISAPVAGAIQVQLADLFRAQAASGAYQFTPETREAANYPVLATMAWDSYRSTRNTAWLSQASYSISRYYTYLASVTDRDGDRLLESRAPWGGEDAYVEDPGFNTMFAADMQRLARINMELRRTMPALYWYDGARVIARAVVARTFDPEAGYFFPADAVNGRLTRHMSPVAALTVSFDGLVGANVADAVVSRQVVPWAADLTRAGGGDNEIASRTVERLVAVDVLREAGRGAEVSAIRAVDMLNAANVGLVSLYAGERAMIDDPLVDRSVALDIFYALVRSCGRFQDADIVRLESAVTEIKSLAFEPGAPHTLDSGERAVRDMYIIVSQFRTHLGGSTFWGPADRAAFPGSDATAAANRLAEDVLMITRRAENRLFDMRYGTTGLKVSTAISGNTAVEGEAVLFRWEFSSASRAFDFKTVQAGVLGEALAPVPDATAVRAGAPARFSVRNTVRPGARSLRLITFMVTVEEPNGTRARRFDERSVYVQPPVGVVARFPRGRIIQGRTVPIEVSLARNSRSSGSAEYFWFSPSGLKLAEGNQGFIQFAATDSARATLNVEVPNPCRPGVFPFTLKFLSGQRDAGTITASLFKPYQWTALGPFPAKTGLNGKLPPESGIGLLQSYAGADGMLTWKPVPESASGPRGEVYVNRVVAGSGVSFLYTVVQCQYETDIEARLVANCPAAVFINGRRAMTVGTTSDSSATVVHLDADRNHILVKFVGDQNSVVGFTIGNNDNLAADEFNNDLMVLAEGYKELVARSNAGDNGQNETHRLVTFRLDDAAAKTVALVGSFNGWSPQSHKLRKRDGKTWEITLSLAPGRYAYRFLIDQKRQVLDPSTRLTEPDGFGGQNSVVIVSR